MKGLPRVLAMAFLAFFLGAATAAGAAEPGKAQMAFILKDGVEKGFNLEKKASIERISEAIRREPEDPLGEALLAVSYLFFYEMGFHEQERREDQEAMLRAVEAAATKSERRLAKEPRDGDAYFALALAKLAGVRWQISQKKYFAAARETGKIWEYLEEVRELDPKNYDVYFVMGLLHYHIDHLPAMSRFLSSVFLTAGDRQKGLEELELAARKGTFLKELARAELISAYANFERQPARALPLARELKEKFPRNYNLAFALGNILSDLGRTDEALQEAREIEAGIKSGTPPYRPELRPRYDLLMGRILFARGEYTRSEEYLRNALKDQAPYNTRIRAWAFVRLGMIHDLRQERKKAEEFYRQALEVKGGEGLAQVAAKKYLKQPYRESKIKEADRG